MTDEEVKKDTEKAIKNFSDKLTPEQLDYCVREWPWTAIEKLEEIKEEKTKE